MPSELLFSWSGRSDLVLPLVFLGLWAGGVVLAYRGKHMHRIPAFFLIGVAMVMGGVTIHSHRQLCQLRVWNDRIEYARGEDAHVVSADEIVRITSITGGRGGRETLYFVRGQKQGRNLSDIKGRREQEYRLALDKFCKRNRIPFEWNR